MDYFLTSRIVSRNSGIEHAEMARLKVFEKLGRSAAIVTYAYANHTHEFIKNAGLADRAVINLFDFFAETMEQPTVEPTLKSLGLPAEASVTSAKNGQFIVSLESHVVAEIEPDQFDPSRWGAVLYLDSVGRVRRKAYLDSRGFIGMALILDDDGHMTHQEFYRPNGSIYLTTWFTKQVRHPRRGRAYLLDYHGEKQRFTDWQSLQTFFYDCLNVGGPHVFISDRAGMTTGAMLRMRTPAIRLEQEHYIHFTDYRDVNSPIDVPRWNDPDFFSAMDGIIVPTQRQRDDVIQRLHPACPVFAVPVGVSRPQPRIPFSQRAAGQLIAVARPTIEKQVDHMIRAVALVKSEHPEVKLTIYGVPARTEGEGELEKLHQLVDQLGLKTTVKFAGYVNDLSMRYDRAQLALLTSRNEGCALALVEAQEHGVPEVAYLMNYGTDEVVIPGQTGELVPQGDYRALATQISHLLDHPKTLASMSASAYSAAERFGIAAVAEKWADVLKQVEG